MIEVPEFKNEGEEAAWWDDHPEVLTEALLQAKAEGRLRRLSETGLPGASSTVTVRLSSEDARLSRELAQRRGIDYHSYISRLVHEALHRETMAPL